MRFTGRRLNGDWKYFTPTLLSAADQPQAAGTFGAARDKTLSFQTMKRAPRRSRKRAMKVARLRGRAIRYPLENKWTPIFITGESVAVFSGETTIRVKGLRGVGSMREEEWNARHVPIIRSDTQRKIYAYVRILGYIRISVPSTQRVQSGKEKEKERKRKKKTK